MLSYAFKRLHMISYTYICLHTLSYTFICFLYAFKCFYYAFLCFMSSLEQQEMMLALCITGFCFAEAGKKHACVLTDFRWISGNRQQASRNRKIRAQCRECRDFKKYTKAHARIFLIKFNVGAIYLGLWLNWERFHLLLWAWSRRRKRVVFSPHFRIRVSTAAAPLLAGPPTRRTVLATSGAPTVTAAAANNQINSLLTHKKLFCPAFSL